MVVLKNEHYIHRENQENNFEAKIDILMKYYNIISLRKIFLNQFTNLYTKFKRDSYSNSNALKGNFKGVFYQLY